jgi:PAS domain-containing protein
MEASEEKERNLKLLEEANETLRRQSERLNLALILIRSLDDRIISRGSGVEELYGWKKEEILGQVPHERFETEFPEPLEEIKTKLVKEGQGSGELIHVNRMMKRYCQEGLSSAIDEKSRIGRPPKLDGTIETKMTLLACSEPPEGRYTWTLKLIADKLLELKSIDCISTMSVQRILDNGNQALAEDSMVHR